jgi:uncharacterized protein
MKWKDEEQSDMLEDRRGNSGGGGGKIIGGGIGTLLLAAIVYFMGGDPSALIGNALNQSSAPTQSSAPRSAQENELAQFCGSTLTYTEKTWQEIFAQSGQNYQKPGMVLFTEGTSSGCGSASSAMGPFYCPADQKVYMDLGFFQELKDKFGAQGGDFAVAYVIAHEVGHHVQNLLGTSGKVDAMRQSGRYSEAQINQASVALELQADYYAGVWAKRTNDRKQILEEGDIEEAMSAAAAVGDDAIQKRAQGYVVPESFTHGTSQQRIEWFKRGFQSGNLQNGDTFSELLR